MANPAKRVVDTYLNRVFLSLNQCYLTLFREGHLAEMERERKLAPHPEEDSHGYYKVRRFFPGRLIQEDELGWPGDH